MCDPITLTATALTAAGTGANYVAGRNASKAAGKTMNANTAMQAAQFDRRTGYVADSDKRVMDLTQRQYGETSALEDQLFSYMLDQSRTRADSQDTAVRGLQTEQAKLNAAREAERSGETQRQLAFQQAIDDLILGTAGATGFDAQQDFAANSFASRMGTTAQAFGDDGSDMGGFSPLADDLVRRQFAKRGAEATASILPEAVAGARVGSMSDAASWADQLAGSRRERAGLVGGRAAVSGDVSDRTMAVSDLREQQAQEHANFAMKLAEDAERMKTSAFGDWASKQGDTLAGYFGNSLGSEQAFTSGMVGSSQNYENQMTSLANYKIQNTQANTLLGDLLQTAGAGVGAYGNAKAASAAAKHAAVRPVATVGTYANIPARTPLGSVPGLTFMGR